MSIKKVKNYVGETLFVYDVTDIQKEKAQYNLIIGERSNGKTYSILELIVKNYKESGMQGAYVRRWADDIKSANMSNLFSSIVLNGLLEGTGFTHVIYRQKAFWFAKREKDKNILDEKPFCYAFSLSAMEHDKSIDYPTITTILFDEFISRIAYLPNEFALFQNVLSSIIRARDNVTIYMCANTVSFDAPYFRDFGISNPRGLKQGEITTFYYGEDKELKMALEYCGVNKNRRKKKSDKYFCFEQSKMITTGAWEMALYPHLPTDMEVSEVVFTACLEFNDDVIQIDFAFDKNKYIPFIFMHKKTTPIRKGTLTYTNRENNDIMRITNVLFDDFQPSRLIREYSEKNRIYFQDNLIGEIFDTYVRWCKLGEYT